MNITLRDKSHNMQVEFSENSSDVVKHNPEIASWRYMEEGQQIILDALKMAATFCYLLA